MKQFLKGFLDVAALKYFWQGFCNPFGVPLFKEHPRVRMIRFFKQLFCRHDEIVCKAKCGKCGKVI